MAAIAAAGYALGSLPWAVIIGRIFWRVDIRTLGSGNTGATNVARVFGPVPGVTVLVLDALKGAAAVVVANALAPAAWGAAGVDAAQVLAAMAAIAGHSFSLFIGFSGGKGVATAAGAILVMAPIIWLPLLAIFLAAAGISRIISIGSILVATSFPISSVIVYPDRHWLLGFAVLATALVIWRHRTNLVRIARGEEAKITFRRRLWDGRGTKNDREGSAK
jgi:glycerol-3-phosphate acyltransferase PlsY